MPSEIRLIGVRQNNLNNLDLAIENGSLLVITGVSGSGKSSLAFDTLYAEGQRRYVETFSPYARQFLDRMDKPAVDRIEGILPAIAINQVNPVRNSRSTVGTMTELNDHLKLLFARLGHAYCRNCAQPIQEDSPETIFEQLQKKFTGDVGRALITFPITVPANFSSEEVRFFLEQQGYTRIHSEEEQLTDKPPTKTPTTSKKTAAKKTVAKKRAAKKQAAATPQRILHVVQDRFRTQGAETSRVMEAIEAALQQGNGEITVYLQDNAGQDLHSYRFSNRLECAQCRIEYSRPLPSTFSFNSPLGACEMCRGFGRVMGIDYGLVIPDTKKTLRDGAITPWQTASNKTHQKDLINYANEFGIRLDTPWEELNEQEKDWVINGDPNWKGGRGAWRVQWYGVKRFFDWLETRAYRMHVRVMLSKYRSYTPCPSCKGSRLKPDASLWRLGSTPAEQFPQHPRFMPPEVNWTNEQLNALPGLSMHDLMKLPLSQVAQFFDNPGFTPPFDATLDLLLEEIRSRLAYLHEVGLGYLSADRQSRTLSGGEVQRINLTTALGTSLVNTLFVLDEPSIGLHSRDVHRITEIMQRLCQNKNTLVVVEHDPQIIDVADRVLDIGPGPGERGGNIIFDGTPQQLRQANTLTGRYLAGDLQVEAPRPRTVAANAAKLILEGVTAHNLKNLSISFPLGHLVVVTGVSGSGKSTLIQDVLYPALLKHQGRPTEAPGPYKQLLGAEQIADVVLVDQSPIGRTARSNPASYVGAFDAIRQIFAQTPLAKERGYTAGTFSFNTGKGRCPTCGGTGFEHVEMQFLSDVYLRCPDCDGKRYRAEILEVKVEHLGKTATIDDVLSMTVHEALGFFKGLRNIQTGLAPLADVGLDYLKLGQPVPTLSGGEAQRLKLAGHLAAANRSRSRAGLLKKGSLFLFDEPTTGLHFDDIARLMKAFRKLLDAGHSLLIIEHNLDVIRAADWLIDLGPEGGDAGGELIAEGSPEQLMDVEHSYTGQALKTYVNALLDKQSTNVGLIQQPSACYQITSKAEHNIDDDVIHVVNAREHNLKGIQVSIPRDQFTVVTGVSGSGKSTLAFDILFHEGQRRYLESINAYARSIIQPAAKPDIDALFGIPPTVAIEQRTSRGGQKSTVATMTEIQHFLRLLYVKLGTQMCPDCQVEVKPQSLEQIANQLLSQHKGQHIGILAPLVTARKGYYTDLASWAASKGYSHLRVDGEFIPVSPWPRLDRYKDHTIELPVADLLLSAATEDQLREALQTAVEHGQGNVTVLLPLTPANDATSIEQRRDPALINADGQCQTLHFSTERACPGCGQSFPEPDPRMFSYNSKLGWCPSCFGTGLQLKGFDAEQTGEESNWQEADEDAHSCQSCLGQRLNKISLAVLWRGHSIAALTQLSVNEAAKFFSTLSTEGREAEIARDIFTEIEGRLQFMQEVGLGYLGLDRSAPTLSGGEAQRIRLAAQLGSNLQGVCYILDEPTIGLHPRDNQILLNALGKLEKNGNTLIVVEHDTDTIRQADHIIDLGPGAGTRGGQIVAQGNLAEIMASPESLTGRFLKNPLQHPMQKRRLIDADTTWVEIEGATLHNLKNINARFPLGRLCVVTGVSGSGKSTLARDILLHNIQNAVADQAPKSWYGCQQLNGWEHIERVLEVDQTPIGKTPRSCPATYIGFWDDVRRLFAETRDAKIRGWTASRFSFNTGDGRCAVCQGQGMRTVEMNFLPDMKVPCEACEGERFNRDTLAIRWQGKNIGQILNMEVDEAAEFFSSHSRVSRHLKLMQDVGLGYLTLGQPSPTLSGGEAQRIKLVSELIKARLDIGVSRTGRASRVPHTLYVLDEPTVGLSTADIEKLIGVLHRLADGGHSVIVIEHNLDIVAEADWIIDLGPEGGDQGGEIVANGSPENLMNKPGQSHTARLLKEFIDEQQTGITTKT